MTQRKERQILTGVAAASLVLCIAAFGLTMNFYTGDTLWEALFVLFLGLACQCAIRLILTTKLRYDHDRLFVTTMGWFQKNRLDKKLAEKESVRQWADLQSYDPEAFRVEAWDRELIIQHTCTFEIVNEINAVAALLVPLLALLADNKVAALIILLILSLGFCAFAALSAARARHFRFNVKAGRF